MTGDHTDLKDAEDIASHIKRLFKKDGRTREQIIDSLVNDGIDVQTATQQVYAAESALKSSYVRDIFRWLLWGVGVIILVYIVVLIGDWVPWFRRCRAAALGNGGIAVLYCIFRFIDSIQGCMKYSCKHL